MMLVLSEAANNAGAALLGGQGGHLPTQLLRGQRQIFLTILTSQNLKICAICTYVPSVDDVKI